MDKTSVARLIRDIPDFPKPGILFKDITPVLQNPAAFRWIVDSMAERCAATKPDLVAAIESRGFIFGSALAYRLGVGIVSIRKKGKLPYKTIEASYDLEYGSATLEAHEDAVSSGQRVVVVDDLLATGGTAGAAARILECLGGRVVGIDFLIELSFLGGRAKLAGYDVNSLVQF